jgi:hypothetical protein
MAVDFHKAFKKLHKRDPKIEVALFVPTVKHAEPQWGATVGRKPGSSEDFNSLAVAYARRMGFIGSDKDARVWFLRLLVAYLVNERSQRLERYENSQGAGLPDHEAASDPPPPAQVVWISTDLLITEGAKAAANFALRNPVLPEADGETKESGTAEAGPPPNTPAVEPKVVPLAEPSALPHQTQARPRHRSRPTEAMKYHAQLYGHLKRAGVLKPADGLPRLDMGALTTTAKVLDDVKFPFPQKWSTEGWDTLTWSDGALYDNRDAFETLLDSGSRRHLEYRDRFPELIALESQTLESLESQKSSANRKKRKITDTRNE